MRATIPRKRVCRILIVQQLSRSEVGSTVVVCLYKLRHIQLKEYSIMTCQIPMFATGIVTFS